MRVISAVALGALVLAPVQVPASEPVQVHEVLFRSMATGRAADDVQRARCAEHIEGRTYATRGSDLDYRVYGMGIAEGSGLVVEHQREDLGPGFMCTMVPDTIGPDGARAYAYFEMPSFGEIEVEGPCRPNATVNSGETFWHCRLDVLPDPAAGIVGGSIATNSVLVIGPQQTQFKTGSLWIGYIATTGIEVPAPVAQLVPTPSQPLGGSGGSMLAFREIGSFDSLNSCPPGSPNWNRSFGPGFADPTSGLIDPTTQPPYVGSLVGCRNFAGFEAVFSFSRTTDFFAVAGVCESTPTPLGPDVRFEVCRGQIAPSPTDGIRGGSVVRAHLVGLCCSFDASWTMFLVRN